MYDEDSIYTILCYAIPYIPNVDGVAQIVGVVSAESECNTHQ